MSKIVNISLLSKERWMSSMKLDNIRYTNTKNILTYNLLCYEIFVIVSSNNTLSRDLIKN